MFSQYGIMADMLHGKRKAYSVLEVLAKIQRLAKIHRQWRKTATNMGVVFYKMQEYDGIFWFLPNLQSIFWTYKLMIFLLMAI